jgi:glycosyltransferase involved in cell wall biosynthesis
VKSASGELCNTDLRRDSGTLIGRAVAGNPKDVGVAQPRRVAPLGLPRNEPHADRERPQVSVVVAHYNQPDAFLHECLDSIRKQTLTSWEAIVVDDGSSVGDARAVVDALGDPRISFVEHERNRGRGAARNTGIRCATAPLIAQVDADDRLAPRFLEATARTMDPHGSADWTLVDLQLFGGSIDVLRWPDPLPVPCPAHFNVRSPGLFRKELWTRVEGYAEGVFLSGGEDMDFWLRVLAERPNLARVPEALYEYRIHPAAASSGSFPYDNHRINNALYRRHRALFDSIDGCDRCTPRNRGRLYRAAGYVTASAASLDRGKRLRALWLAARAVAIRPRQPGALRQLLQSAIRRSTRTARAG